MSTDDLTRRAREWARLLPEAWPETKDLVSELADEVDRLRDIATRETAAHETHVARLTTERDAARAALERVRGYTRIRVTPFGLTQDESLTWQQGYDAAIERLLTILEGES